MATRQSDAEHDRSGDRSPTAHRESAGQRTDATIDRAKRAVAAAIGAVLLVRGLRRRSLRGAATALAGGWLLYRALGGRERVERALPTGRESGGGRDDRTETTGPVEVSRSVTVGRPAEELYEAWRDPGTFSRVVGHFADVTSTDGERFHWTVRGPGGRDLSWETRVVEEEPGEFVRWETPADATVSTDGSVRFHPARGDRGTVVTLTLGFDPPGGTVGDAVLERLDVAPKALAGTALGRFKSLAETGEIQTLAANPSARGRGDLL